MQKKAFYFNLSAQTWRECADAQLAFADIEQIPVHFLLRQQKHLGDIGKTLIWCPAHRTYEEVSAYDEHSLATLKGCKFAGLFATVEETADEHTCKRDILIRSRLLYNESKGIVTVFADMATVYFPSIKDRQREEMTYIPRSKRYKAESVSVILRDKKIIPQDKLKKIPIPTAKAALTFLKYAAEQILGRSIKLPNSVKSDIFPTGESIIAAFLYNPGDMNLWLLKDYFQSGQDYFGASTDDNFLDLCHAFHLEPEESLKALYDYNPLALPVLFALHVLGINKR